MTQVSVTLGRLIAGRMRRLADRLARETSGIAAVEFAMIVPIMFFLFVGAVEFSNALTVDRRVTQSASSTADLIARAPSQGLTVTQVDSELRIIEQLIEPYDLSLLTVKITSVKAVGGAGGAVTYTVDWSRDNRGGTPYSRNSTFPQEKMPAGLLSAGESVIVAEATYNYQPLLFKYFITEAFDLEEKFFLKPRNASCVHLQPVNCVTGGAL